MEENKIEKIDFIIDATIDSKIVFRFFPKLSHYYINENSQTKLNLKNAQDPKSLIKTLSSTQRARYHLEDNYKNLVRLIEAKKKRWN